jgi:S-adenosylmethionine hydrolase
VSTGSVVALVDSTDFVAIAVRNGNAAEALSLSIGSVVALSPKSALPGMPS